MDADGSAIGQPVRVNTFGDYEVDAAVTSGRGTRPRVSPPSALLGIACMPRDNRGYAGLVGTNGTEIVRDGHGVLDHRIALTPLRKLWIAWNTARRP